MDPLEPKPPRPVPPAPPRPEWIKPAAAAPRRAGSDAHDGLLPAPRRERSSGSSRSSASARRRRRASLAHQESLKNEVDAHLKALTDQLKREKLERDGDEARSHSRGRVEALEKRLDEMNSTFAQLLKDAVSSRDGGPSSAALAAELSAFRGALKDGMDGVARWRGELRELSALVPQVQGLTERLPQDEKLFEESVGRRLDEFSARLARSLEDWKRAQEAGRAELDARVEALARERARPRPRLGDAGPDAARGAVQGPRRARGRARRARSPSSPPGSPSSPRPRRAPPRLRRRAPGPGARALDPDRDAEGEGRRHRRARGRRRTSSPELARDRQEALRRFAERAPRGREVHGRRPAQAHRPARGGARPDARGRGRAPPRGSGSSRR